MTVAVIKTNAEQAFQQNFEQVAGQLPGRDSVQAERRRAMEDFSRLGLPHRRIEAWKYTDLRSALREALPPVVEDRTKLTIADVIVAMGPLASLEDAHRLVFVNGRFRGELSSQNGLAGFEIKPLAAVLEEAREVTGAGLAHVEAARDDAVVALNTAYMSDGAVMGVAPGAELAKPVLLVFVRAGSERRFTATRNILSVGRCSNATLIEAHVTLPGTADDGQVNTAIEIMIAESAQLDHVKCATDTGSVTHLSTGFVRIGQDASYRAFHLTAGPQLARSQSFVTFTGTGGKLDFSGVFLARGTQHVDTTLVIDHAVPQCESRELFKGVLDDQARGVFQGKVIVRPDAQKTDGKQMAQVLMLSEDAEFDSKPELEIYADDVVCGHGTTSAQLDEDHLFYCRARGIPEAEARALLIEAFVGEAMEKVAYEGVREALSTIARTWLAATR